MPLRSQKRKALAPLKGVKKAPPCKTKRARLCRISKFDTLPNELPGNVFQNHSYSDLAFNISLVCKRWNIFLDPKYKTNHGMLDQKPFCHEGTIAAKAGIAGPKRDDYTIHPAFKRISYEGGELGYNVVQLNAEPHSSTYPELKVWKENVIPPAVSSLELYMRYGRKVIFVQYGQKHGGVTIANVMETVVEEYLKEVKALKNECRRKGSDLVRRCIAATFRFRNLTCTLNTPK